MRTDILYAQMMNEVFFVQPSVMKSLTSLMNDGIPRNEAMPSVANESVVLQKINNIAIINIDGAMYKKDMSGLCMNVASYQKIALCINQAVKMYQADEVIKLGFRVTTPGGTIYGLDALHTIITKIEMPTFTLFEDLGASAGIYAFTATDKVYASPMTELGSIGAVVTFMKDKDDKMVSITSSRAKNKRLNLEKKEDLKKVQAKLDVYENRFYEVVEQNTGFTAEQIEKEFDNGSTIMADKALEIGFIDDIITFEDLIERESGGSSAAIPGSTAKLANKSKIGATMKFDRENLDATEQSFNTLLESRGHLNANIKELNFKLKESAANLETKETELKEVTKKLELKEAEHKTTTARLQEASTTKVDAETALKMVSAESDEEASKIALSSTDTTPINQSVQESKKDAWVDFNFKG